MTSYAQATWIGPELQLVGETAGGLSVALDHALDGEERAETGFRPLQLLLVGLCGCTAMDVVSVLQKKRQPFTGLQVKATAEQASEHPQVYTRIHLQYIVRGQGVAAEAVARAIELSQTKYCPAAAMLGKTATITTQYEIVEE